MDERRVVYIEHAKAVRRYLRAVDRREEIESSEEWRRSPRYLEILEITEELVVRSRNELAQLRAELENSPNVEDRIYYYAIVEEQKPAYIAKMTDYCERQIRRIIGNIQENIKKSLD